MTLPDDSFIGRMLAFVRPEGDQGPILVADGAYAGEIRAGGWDISDHDMPVPTSALRGLLVFEGLVESTRGPDPDVSLVGEWRHLTHWEMCRVVAGFSPWSDAP